MSRWKLGSALGIGIYMHWSFLLLPAFAFGWSWRQAGTAEALFVLVYLAALVVCVVLHELGHAAMARYYGIPTRDITLYPIGGVARLERMTDEPWHEFFIALAGPAVNLAIAALLALAMAPPVLFEGLQQFFQHSYARLLGLLFFGNLFLVVFNMLPAFPMDGGRVLRALLALRLGRLRATEIAAGLGLGLATLMIVGGLFWGLQAGEPIILPLVGLFLAFVGQMELAAVRQHERNRREEPLDVLPATPVEVAVEARAGADEPRFSGLAWDVSRRAWVLWQDGRVIATFGAKSE